MAAHPKRDVACWHASYVQVYLERYLRSGAIFETAVLGEIMRRRSGRGERPHLYFWRTSAGVEVDLIVETAGKRIPIEIKMSATPDRENGRLSSG